MTRELAREAWERRRRRLGAFDRVSPTLWPEGACADLAWLDDARALVRARGLLREEDPAEPSLLARRARTRAALASLAR